MNKILKTARGSICIFLALVMLPMMTVGGLIVDGSRISAARTGISGAGDLAMNAALSEYDQILYDVYGIFAISEDMEELEANVSMYFSNAINNSGVLNDSDSYTREFINNIFSSYSSSELEFNNIVDMEVETFDLSGISSSSIANPTVLERQIIDYMKFRGPINMGKGLLTKLGCIGETSKQTKALEAKVDYDKKLGTVQEACETAYNAINTYNSLVSSSSKYSNDNYLANLAADIEQAQKDTKTMTEYITAKNSSALKVESLYNTSYGYKDMAGILIEGQPLSLFNLDSETKNAVEKYYSDSEAENKVIDTMNYIEGSLAGTIKLKPLEDGTYEYEQTEFTRALSILSSDYKTELPDQISAIVLHNNVPDMKKVFTYTVMYSYYLGMLSDEEKVAYEAKCEAFEAPALIMLASSEFCSGYTKEWEGKANQYGKSASSRLYAWYQELDAINTALTDSIDALDTVIDKVDELEDAGVTWSNRVNNLSEGDIKTSMQGDYNASAKNINEDAINELKEVLTNNQNHFKAIKERLDGIKFFNKNICRSDYNSANYYSEFSSSIGESAAQSYTEISSTAESIINNNYTNKSVTDITPAVFEKITEEGDKMQFYKYLVRVCASSDAESNEASKSEAKDLKKSLIETGNEGSSSTAAELLSGVPDTISSAIPSDVQQAIDDIYAVEAGKTDSFDAKPVDSDGEDSDIATQNKDNLSAVSTLLESLGDIAESARDDLLVQEYLTEMFSCYTDTIPQDGVVVATAMNGKDMTSNKFFGAEAEYILWGKDDVQSNLNNTKAMIFGIRFALNSIYAFTSSDTRTPAMTAATAIAGWTGFGVPIVQTVILLAWAMAESYVDVTKLCEGEAVALYKSKDTWFLGYGGLKSTLADGVEKIAGHIIDDVFTEIENAAIDASEESINNITNTINEYTENTLNGVYDSVRSAISVPVQQLALQIAGASKELSENDIMEMVENTLSELDSEGSGLVNECINMAVEYLLSSEKAYIVNKMVEIYNSSKNGTTIDVINEMLYGDNGETGLIGDLNSKIQKAIEDKVDEYGNDFKTEISTYISSGTNDAKEYLKGKISDFTSGIAGGSSASIKSSTAAASGFSMTYKEYLKVFFMIHILVSDSNKDAMLIRASELIQANISQKESGFNIGKAYTMVQSSAVVNVRTTFFSVPVSTTDASGNTTYGLDFSNIGSGWQQVKYTSVLGY